MSREIVTRVLCLCSLTRVYFHNIALWKFYFLKTFSYMHLLINNKIRPLICYFLGSLDSLTNLHNLTIENVQLTRIEGAAFQKLTLLLRIDLRHNKLTAIQNSTFKGLHYLRHLDLSYNSIANIQQGAFTSLINLKVIIIIISFNFTIICNML